MSAGYLIVEAQASRPDRVRIFGADRLPWADAPAPASPSAERICFAARFSNLHVARMHAHAALKRRTLDAETGLYRTDPVTAVAAIEAIDLKHEPVFIEPAISADPRLAREVGRRRRSHRRVDRVFNAIGFLAIGLLIMLVVIVL